MQLGDNREEHSCQYIPNTKIIVKGLLLMDKILTVSIAAFNVENYIKQALDSLCDKEILPVLEIFVVDDGGTDKTLEIAQSYERKYPDSFKVIHKENGGWGSTVNYSIQHATGKYFRLLDGDDYFDPSQLKKLVLLLKEIDVDAVYTPYRRFDDKTSRTIQKFSCKKKYPLNEILDADIVKNIEFSMPASTFKTKLLKENNVTILEKCFYTEYRTKAIAYAKKFYITNFEVYQYRIGRFGQSVSLAGLNKHIDDNLKIIREMIAFKNDLGEWANVSLVQRYLKNAIDFQYNSLIVIGDKEKIIEFDNELLKNGESVYRNQSKRILRMRKNNFCHLKLVSCAMRLKMFIVRNIKMLINT